MLLWQPTYDYKTLTHPLMRQFASCVMKDLRITVVQERPHQPFYSGSSVAGAFLIGVDEPKSYKYISIQFLGRAFVHWTEQGPQGTGVDCTSLEVYVDVRQTL